MLKIENEKPSEDIGYLIYVAGVLTIVTRFTEERDFFSIRQKDFGCGKSYCISSRVRR